MRDAPFRWHVSFDEGVQKHIRDVWKHVSKQK